MNFTYENQGTNTYLVYEIGTNDELDTMSLGMLTNNTIPGFAAASFTQMDATKYIKYNVSAKVSVAQLFSGPVNKKRLVGVFTGIVDAMLSAEDYMLDTNNILLDLDHIFTDVSTCETVVVCLPVMNVENTNPELGMFFKNIVFNTQFDRTENCDHVAQIINYLNSNPILSLADFKELLEQLEKEEAPAAAPAQPEPAPVQQPVQQTVQQPAVTPVASVQQPVVPAKQEAPVAAAEAQPAIPEKPEIPQIPESPQAKEEKPMSMLYLLRHYNKENAAIYKAQQEAKKKKNSAPAKKSAKKPAKTKEEPKQSGVNFAIPGQQESIAPTFAMPDQQSAATPEPTPVQPVAKTEVQPSVPRQETVSVQQPVQQSASQSRSISFGETTVLGGPIGETTVLNATAEPNRVDPHLIRVKNNEKIPLNKPVFRIGKERSYVDYFISDNTAISRSHANIVNHNGEFFVVDTNSTNHTYVNGGMIPSNVETKLSHGTKLRFANEDFEFKLY